MLIIVGTALTSLDTSRATIQRTDERATKVKVIDQGHAQSVGAAGRGPHTAEATVQSRPEAGDDAASRAGAVTVTTKKDGAHFFRWLVLGMVTGAGYAYYRSRQRGDADAEQSGMSDASVSAPRSALNGDPRSAVTPEEPAASNSISAPPETETKP